ncbi:MAG: acyl-CoA mutase large subunit family protein [Candidatus Cloacimonetes bacterium]|nr:acyl-CoA mutase large subunit family protein [Candidatus Cloacimonadota bacterium]
MESETKNGLNLLAEFPPHTLEEWKQAVIGSLKGADYDKTMLTKTYEGITLKPIYTKADMEGKPWLASLPGQAPYLRGDNPDGYTEGSWIVAQAQDEKSLVKLNKIILDELYRGLNCVHLKPHPATLAARLPHKDDLDKRGVTLNNLDDLKTALRDVDLKAVPFVMFGNKSMILVMGMLNAWAKSQGVALRDLHGSIACDPFRDEEPDFDILAQMTRWVDLKAPRLGTILLDGAAYEAQGASAVQELAYSLASAHQIIGELTQRGLSIEQLAPRFNLSLSLGSNLFMEIAKIRAARMLWSQLIKSWGGSENAQRIWIHGVTAAFNKSSYDVWVNLLRTTTEGFAGVIGGVDSLEITPFDDTVRVADEFSRRIARNQQLILAEEAHFTKVVDPAGGCWYVEALAAELCEKAWGRLQEIEAAGGFLSSLQAGTLDMELQTLAKARIAAVNTRRDVKVGVNMFANPGDELLKAPSADPAWLDEAMERYAELKKRPSSGLEDSLKLINEDRNNDFMVDMICDAWLHNADIEQIASALGWNIRLRRMDKERSVGMMEALRMAVEASSMDTRVQLLNMGSVAQYKARADFSSGFFQTAGFKLLDQSGFDTPDLAIAAVAETQVPAVCICSTDDLYVDLVPRLCTGLKRLPKPPVIILAGYPADKVEDYKAAGVDIFIHIRANNYDTNKELAMRLGVTL